MPYAIVILHTGSRSQRQFNSPVLEFVRENVAVTCFFYTENLNDRGLWASANSPDALVVDSMAQI